MRFICDSCRAQYMISDDKVGAKGAKVRCKKCGHVIFVRRAEPGPEAEVSAPVPSTVETEAASPAGAVGGSPTSDASTPSTGRNKQLTGAEILSGVDDEEIGAVFDQALSIPDEPPAPATNGATDTNEALRELASQQAGTTPAEPRAWDMAAPAPAPTLEPAVTRPEPELAAVQEWYVAIDEKQVGPVGLEKVKALWDSGEIGPDSLCWRAGLPDWLPLSEVKELFSTLAPKPSKPVIIAAPQTPQPAVTTPVESVLTGSPSKIITAPPAPPPEEAGGLGWRPSAASTLASLMKEEIEALSKPAAPTAASHVSSPGIAPPGAPSLVDVPSGPAPIQVPVPITMGSLHYTPVRQGRKGLVIALSVGGVLLIAVAVLATMLFTRAPSTGPGTVERAQIPPPKPQGTPVNEPPKVTAQTPSAAQRKPEGSAAPAGSGSQPADATAKASTTPPPVKTGTEVAGAEKSSSSDSRRERGTGRRRRSVEEAPPTPAQEKGEVISSRSAEPPRGSADDDFERVFGTDKSDRKVAKPEQKRSASVYVPPPPGTVDTPDSLGQSDVMQVVVSNKPAILGCVAEQKKRDPNLSGRIVMRWTIHTNGKVSNVSCQSDEFKSAYIASCIAGLIKGWSFPKHKVQGDPINFPFTF